MSKHIGIAIGLIAAAGGLYLFMGGPESADMQATGKDDASSRHVANASASSAVKRPPPSSGQKSAGAPGSGNANAMASTATSTAQATGGAPLPEPIHRRQAPPPVVDLWQVDPNDPQTLVDSIPATQISVAPDVLNSLHVGQQVAMTIPSLNKKVTAEVQSTHNQLNNVEVYKGPVLDGHDKDNVIITRGKTNTHVIVATRDGVYSGVLNNQSGKGTLTDEGEINARMRGLDDAVSVPGLTMPSPETAQNH